MKSSYEIIKLKKKQKQSSKKVFCKTVMKISKNNIQLLTIWTKSTESKSKDINF